MRRILWRATAVALVTVMLAGVTGCVDDRVDTEQLQQAMLDYLSATYDEQFVAEELSLNSYYYGSDVLTVHSAADPDVVFNVYKDSDSVRRNSDAAADEDAGPYWDDYPLGKWNAELTERFGPMVSDLVSGKVLFRAYVVMAPADITPEMAQVSLDDQLASGKSMDVYLVLACAGDGDQLLDDPEPYFLLLEQLRSLGVSTYMLSVGFLDDPQSMAQELRGTVSPDWVNASVEKNAYLIVDQADGVTDAVRLSDMLHRTRE